jgi:MFS family permease
VAADDPQMSTGATDPPPSRTFWVIVLLSLVLLINFIDRGAMSTAAPLIQHDLRLTNTQFGFLFSVFFWTYASTQVPVGWLSDRYGAQNVLSAGLALWAAATALTGFTSGFAMLVGLRLLLGLGESVGFPTVSAILTSAVPPRSLGRANGIVAVGYLIGPGIGVLLAGLLIDQVGWRGTFVTFGIGSILWLVPWFAIRPPRLGAQKADPYAPTLGAVLRKKAFWGTTVGLFSCNYMSYFILSWLPGYLVEERGFSMHQMEHTATTGYLVSGLSALLCGWVVDRFVANGRSAILSYKMILCSVQVGAVPCMLAMGLGAQSLGVAGLFGFQILIGVAAPCIYALSQILAGPKAAGRWVGTQNAIGNLPGAISPWITGIIVDRTGHFALAFVAAAVMSAIGIVGWIGILPTSSRSQVLLDQEHA